MKRLTVLPAMIALLSACGGSEPAPADTTADDTAAVAQVEEAAPAEDAAPLAVETAQAGAPDEEKSAEATGEASAGGAATAAPMKASAARAIAAATPPASFTQCKVCHAVEPGKNGLGPSLAGVFGATAGHEPSFAYSTAMKESGKVWNEANLGAYLESPRSFIPGNKMSFAGLRDPAKRKELIDYLKTL